MKFLIIFLVTLALASASPFEYDEDDEDLQPVTNETLFSNENSTDSNETSTKVTTIVNPIFEKIEFDVPSDPESEVDVKEKADLPTTKEPKTETTTTKGNSKGAASTLFGSTLLIGIALILCKLQE